MDEPLRKKICRLIAGIVVADDDLDDKEDAFLDLMMVKFGIPADQREELFPIVDKDEAVAEINTLAADVQDQAFDLLVDAACADGQVVPEERAYLEAVGAAIGLDAKAVEERVVDGLSRV